MFNVFHENMPLDQAVELLDQYSRLSEHDRIMAVMNSDYDKVELFIFSTSLFNSSAILALFDPILLQEIASFLEAQNP